MQTNATCPCQLCNGHIEFDPSLFQTGTIVTCPHCGVETRLFISQMPVSSREEAVFTNDGAVEETAEEAVAPQQEKLSYPIKDNFSGQVGLIVTTGNDVAGRTIESYLGIVRGIVVRSPDLIQGMFGGLKQIVGGNIESYARVCEDARKQAFDRMVAQAKAMRADAVIAVRYDATEFAQGVTEVLAYGTAVKLVQR